MRVCMCLVWCGVVWDGMCVVWCVESVCVCRPRAEKTVLGLVSGWC